MPAGSSAPRQKKQNPCETSKTPIAYHFCGWSFVGASLRVSSMFQIRNNQFHLFEKHLLSNLLGSVVWRSKALQPWLTTVKQGDMSEDESSLAVSRMCGIQPSFNQSNPLTLRFLEVQILKFQGSHCQMQQLQAKVLCSWWLHHRTIPLANMPSQSCWSDLTLRWPQCCPLAHSMFCLTLCPEKVLKPKQLGMPSCKETSVARLPREETTGRRDSKAQASCPETSPNKNTKNHEKLWCYFTIIQVKANNFVHCLRS